MDGVPAIGVKMGLPVWIWADGWSSQCWYDNSGLHTQAWRLGLQYPTWRIITQTVICHRRKWEYVHLRLLRLLLEREHERRGRHRVREGGIKGGDQVGR